MVNTILRPLKIFVVESRKRQKRYLDCVFTFVEKKKK